MACFLCLSSCEDFFESTVTIETPKPENTMYITSSVLASDTVARVSVTRTLSVDKEFFGIPNEALLNDAEVNLRDENTGVEFSLDNDLSDIFPINFVAKYPVDFLQSGHAYTLEVKHPDFPTASVNETMPEKITIQKLEFEMNGGVNLDGNQRSAIYMTFNDPPGENFYEVSVLRKGNSRFSNTYIDASDPSSTRAIIDENLLLEDSSFEGKQKRIALKIGKITEETAYDRYYVLLKSVNESYYRFSKTFKIRQDVGDENPFQSPVQLYSSFENALGFFALSTRHLKKLEK